MARLEFDPAAHGYHFANTFVNRVIPAFNWSTGGLCGGMTMSALDYWRSASAIPCHSEADFGPSPNPDEGGVPAEGTRMRSYIYERQMHSLLTKMMFTRWVVFPGFVPDDFHSWATGVEFNTVRAQIDKGRPAMIGLWSIKPGDPSGGHQILCYGYESATKALYVYDPNTPDIECILTPVSAAVGCELRRADDNALRSTWRGYFWTDVYNWDEAPHWPAYHDLEISDGVDIEPEDAKFSVGGRLTVTATVRNVGEYSSTFDSLFVWARGPRGENLDSRLGGAEAGLTRLAPGEQRKLHRTADPFTNVEGLYSVGISLNKNGRWLSLPLAPGALPSRFVNAHSTKELVIDQVVNVPESASGDVDTQVDLLPGDEFALSSTGSIWAGVWFANPNDAVGWPGRHDAGQPMPAANVFSLIARCGNDPYFVVGSGLPRQGFAGTQSQRLFLRINDSVPNNGSGLFQCTVRVWR